MVICLQSQYGTFCLDLSLEYLTSAVYLSRSGYTLIFGAKGEGSPARPLFAGHRRGRSLRNTHVLNRGGQGVRSPIDSI